MVTSTIRDLIADGDITSIREYIADGAQYGMQTFDQALLGFVTDGMVSEQVAMATASSPHDFKLMLAARGQRASGIEQVLHHAGDAPASNGQ